MKTNYTDKTAYMGAGMGLAVYTVFGLLPAAYLGGIAGLSAIGAITGFPVTAALLPRIVVALGMAGGVLAGAVMCAAGCAALGWLMGAAADAMAYRHEHKAEAAAHK